MANEWVTIQEGAPIAGVCVNTVRNRLKSGRLVGKRDTRNRLNRWLVRRDDMEQFQRYRTDGALRSPDICRVVGITYRQLDYWTRNGTIVPSIHDTTGSGDARRYSPFDALLIAVTARLNDGGLRFETISKAIDALREIGPDSDVSDLTVLSDGIDVALSRTQQDVLEMFDSGRLVYGLAIGPVSSDLSARLRLLVSG